MTNYTLTFQRSTEVLVRNFSHEAGLSVLSAMIAKQGYLVIPDGATNALGSGEEPMTVFSRSIISLQTRPNQRAPVEAAAVPA